LARQPNQQSGGTAGSGNNPNSKSYEKTIAHWTRILGASTVVLVIATGISAYFLFETDRTIKKQVEAAGIQLRAYINFNQIVYFPHFSSDPNKPGDLPPGANVGVTWKNFGTTPAREATYWIAAKWYQTGSEPDFSKPSDIMADKPNMTLGPGTEISSVAVFVPMADIQKLTVKNGRVFLWGHISYMDYIPDSPLRHFHFCMYAEVLPAVPPGAFNIYKPECNYAN
jgi:hypothetical protein